MKKLLLTTLIGVAAISACAKDPAPSESSEAAPIQSPTPTSAALIPTRTPTNTPTNTPISTPISTPASTLASTPTASPSDKANEDESALRTTKAKEALARHLGVETTTAMVVESLEAVSWGDTSLGCPQPGRMYAQVVTEGYKAWLRYEGKRYPVHMMSRGAMVCSRSISNIR